ncbi:hypothetical protein B9Z31_06600 [Limnohabitans sp. G3-2]|nr:hypothetical protein B9Z31_06600 [Limnohabitans sp. G3-2]
MPLSSTFKKQFKHLCALGEKINTYAGQIMAMPVAGDGVDTVPVLNLIGKLQVNWLTAATATPELAKIYRQSIKVMPSGKLPTIDLDPESVDEEQAGYLFGVVFYALMLWDAAERAVASSRTIEKTAHSLESRTLGHYAQQQILQLHCTLMGQRETYQQQEIQKSLEALLEQEFKLTQNAKSEFSHSEQPEGENRVPNCDTNSELLGSSVRGNDLYLQAIQQSIEALLAQGHTLNKNAKPAFRVADLWEGDTKKLAHAMDVELLDVSAWAYDQSLRANPRFITIAADFDGDAHRRAGLTEELKRFVAATVVSNDPDRFQTLWKATIGSAASSLKWRPPHRPGNPIPEAASSSSLVRRAIRVLRMVNELHKAGYQRLRVFPHINGSGTAWRADITYVENVRDDGFSPIDHELEGSGKVARYSTAQGNQYFGWMDASTADARELARLFLMRFPHICNLGQGLDWAYAGWLVDAIGWAEQCADESGLLCFWSDSGVDPEHMRRWQPPPPIRL